MLLDNNETTKAQLNQQGQRCAQFAARTAEAIGAARHCPLSLLPYEKRLRQAASWYEACGKAMLRGDYAQLDEWIRQQASMAVEEHFELEDLLQLLRICRRSAIEVERWDEDVFSAVDDVINEMLLSIRAKVPWNISDDLNYLKEAGNKPAPKSELIASEAIVPAEIRENERRDFGRNRLALQIRVRGTTQQGHGEEITYTQNASLSGLYFKTGGNYREGSPLQVTYPYWTGQGSINKEYPARIVRRDRLPDRAWGIAVEFLQSPRHKTA